MTKKILLIALLLTNMALISCSGDDSKPQKAALVADKDGFVTTTIMGSAESPDPVLAKVRAFEKTGVVKNVIVMESYPTQIKITTKPEILKVFEKMYRKPLTQ